MRLQVAARARAWWRTPSGAALLSFVFPGLGQLATGDRVRAGIVALPAVATIGAIGTALLVDRKSVLSAAFDQRWLSSLLILDVLALVYHAWSILDAYRLAARRAAGSLRAGPLPKEQRRHRAPSPVRKWAASAAIAVLLSGTVLVHAAVGSTVMNWQNDLSCWSSTVPCWIAQAQGATFSIASDNPEDAAANPNVVHSAGPSDAGSAAPSDSSASLDPNAIPTYLGQNDSGTLGANGQLNVLLFGVDAGPGGSRNQGLRPDSMILLHIDLSTGQAAMIGLPRNMYCVPLPKGTAEHYPNISTAQITYGCPPYTWAGMLEDLWQEAAVVHPANFPYYQTRSPDNDYLRGITALEQAIGTLTGLHIDGVVQINLMGFVNLINDLGGITIDVPTRVVDHPCGPAGTPENKYGYCPYVHDGYGVPEGTGDINLDFEPGIQHMNGDQAEAYARTREFSSDYDRMKRQQLVLKALRGTLDPCTVLPRIPSLISDLGTAFWTNLPLDPSLISQWAGLAEHISSGSIKSITLDPTTTGARNDVLTAASAATARNVVAHSLDGVPVASGSGGGGGGGFSC
jgi:anionic cell wall polymer biosynthesis LytR-Cps2A-Psr (LCP) family protein